MAQKADKKGLGRGLSALLADTGASADADQAQPPKPEATIPIDVLHANPDQPRRTFGEQELEDLTASIREKGILQPLIVRPAPGRDGHYQIVAGERRWRAAQRAAIHDIPVLIRDLTDTEVLELGIIENVQRADLNPLEEAMGYQQLMDRFGHTQEKIATALGKSRSHIANLLRLLALPQDVQWLVSSGKLSAGHARALITVDNPIALARQVVDQGLSVRQTEDLVKKLKTTVPGPRKGRPEKDADTRALEADLSAHLGIRVQIQHGASGQSGELKIQYKTLEQLDGLCQLLTQ